ncbi:glycoside hydrolase [Mucilaginibacter limnophilus]|uniref:Glycoside hydrolase n=1 Tax=Mucilaginibacter limnophilus TaxID=1932778 RepID=A0A3S2UNR8_9SPHI|nr:glycosyl hydrolase [Mucilaginibacter limnophilus]RVU02997.1 glycoside hydrolase [Mucilaginibacter limnophilus]
MTKLLPIYLIALTIFLAACGKSDSNKPADKDDDDKPDVEVPNTPFKTLNYLYSVSGKNTVAGMHNREPASSPKRWTDELKATTGKFPGLWSNDFFFRGADINNRPAVITEAIAQWEQGAIVNLMWHACNPAFAQPCEWDGGSGVLSKLSDDEWTELITDGTALNNKWKERMDEVSIHLKTLKDNGVEVLWRPFHEMNQGAFWWGGRPGPSGTRKLYQLTHDYMTDVKGLTNLIWVWDMQDFATLQSDLTAYYPGDEYFDIAALDCYDGSGYTTAKYTAMVNIAKGKPIGIGECDKFPTTAQLAAQPKWTFFMGWSELVYNKNTGGEINALFNSSRVLTLDELPGWE